MLLHPLISCCHVVNVCFFASSAGARGFPIGCSLDTAFFILTPLLFQDALFNRKKVVISIATRQNEDKISVMLVLSVAKDVSGRVPEATHPDAHHKANVTDCSRTTCSGFSTSGFFMLPTLSILEAGSNKHITCTAARRKRVFGHLSVVVALLL